MTRVITNQWSDRLSLRYELDGSCAGDVRFQAELRSSTLREPVIKQESTNIIVPNGNGVKAE